MYVKRLDLEWQANRKAWITTAVMTDWFYEFDKKMRKQRRKVFFFWDNATPHPDLELKNVKLVYLLPNTTLHAQSLDQEIV